MRVWRVVLSWGNMLSVGVLLFGKHHSACKVSLEGLSLLVQSGGKLASGLGEGSVEGIVVDFDLVVELGLGVDFGLGESVSKIRSESIEVVPLHLAESFELLILDIESFSEGTSSLADGLSDGGRLGFKELDEVELVVRVVHEVDLLELSGLSGVESGLLLSKSILKCSALDVD